MNTNIRQNNNGVTIKFEGELTIERASELKNILLNSFENNNSIIIDISDSQRIDLSCIQLLYSVLKTATKKNKKISFIESSGNILKKESEAVGLICNFNFVKEDMHFK